MKVRATQDGTYAGYYRTEGEVFEIDEKPFEVKNADTGKPVFETDENGKVIKDQKGNPKVKMGTWFSKDWMEPVQEETEVTNDYPPFQLPVVYRAKKNKPAAGTVSEPKIAGPVI